MLFKPILKKLCITWATAIVVFVTGVCAAPVEKSELVSSASIQWQTSDSLAVLGKGTVTNARSVLISTDSLFMGGISVNNQAFQRQVTQDLSDTVEIQGVISVDPADVGKTADIFVYIDAETASGRVDLVLSQDKILLWDGNLKNLVPMINNVSLAAVQPVAIYQGTFQATGHLRIYFGYGLADGTLVFNSQPLETTIEEESSTRKSDKENSGKSDESPGNDKGGFDGTAGNSDKTPPGQDKKNEPPVTVTPTVVDSGQGNGTPSENNPSQEDSDSATDNGSDGTPSATDQGSGTAGTSTSPANNPNPSPSSSSSANTNNTGKSDKVSPGQAKKISYDGAELDVGADAVSGETTLTIDACVLPPLDSGMVNVTKGNKCYRFLPKGMKFKQPVNVKIPYDKGFLPAGYIEDDIKTFFYNEEESRWQVLERAEVDKTNQAITSKTTHFTDMINSVVTVPDAPQTASNVPTQFKDMKAADPSTKINLIEPPQANNMGTANLGYPIEVPPGRAGLQPQIALSYNSGGGNGWVGVGWDLPVPAITVDTGWGVPHYYGDRESENYRINGESLTPPVHRDVLQPRTAEKEFFPRVVSQFRRIIRHGNHPSNYWWEITDKDGKVSYYGGDPTTGGPAADSTLTDGSGNVFSWALREVKDLNGNNIQYRCERVHGQVGFASGVSLYLKTINYTGFNGQAGPYQVKFLRSQGRSDAASNGRGGFMQMTGDLLKNIEVTYQDQMIRSYELKYQASPFLKMQLASVTQFGETGEAFNTHTFDYYDDISATQGFAPMAGWGSGHDGLGGFLGQSSAISITQGNETGKSLSANVGLSAPVIGSVFSVGGSKSSSKSNSEGLLVLADINADGLPDKVFKRGNLVFYRPNLSGPNGIWQFGEPALIANLPGISEETSTSKTSGKSLKILIVSASSSKTKTKTEQPVYFLDRNGDGLVDLAYNGTILFNHRDANGNHYFSPNSADTPYPLGIADSAEPLTTEELGIISSISDSLTQEYAIALQEFQDTSPLVDTVRRWQAPYDGQIGITGTVALVQDTSAERQNYKTADGVRVAIQHNDNELWSSQIAATDYAAKSPTGVDALTVKKGDVIYFRVQSIDDGAYDQVLWNPVIQYANVTPAKDANQFDVYRYEATKDFTSNGGYRGTFVDVLYTGKVQLAGELKKIAATSDDVTLEVLKNGEVIDSQTLASTETGSIELKQDIDVVAKDRLMVRVKIDSPIDLSKLQWNPTNLPVMSYLSSEDPEIEQPVIGLDGNPVYRYAIVSNYDIYPLTDVTTPLEAWTVPQSGTYTVKPLLAMIPGETTADSTLTLTVKRTGELVAKQTITVTNNVISNDSFTLQAKQDEKLYFEFNTLNPELLTKLSQISAGVSGPGASNLSVPVALNSAESAQMIPPAYRGWSVFGYNGDGERATMPIKITATDLSGEELATQTAALQAKYAEFAKKAEATPQEDEAALEALEDEMEALVDQEDDLQKQVVIKTFLPDVETQMWQGPDEGTWVKAETMSSSRDGLDHLDIPEPATALSSLDPTAVAAIINGSSQSLTPDGVPNFAGAMSISRTSRCESKTKSLSIGFSKASASKSKTKSKCYGEDDMMDFNGDSFPEMFHVWGVQFTNMRGNLSGQVLPWYVDGIRHTYATSKSKGAGASGGGSPKIGANSKGRTDNSGCSAPGNNGSINLTASVSANKSTGESDIKWDLLDVNGDGLIDRVDSLDGILTAAFGIGYNFVGPAFLGSADINKGQNSSFDVGLGLDVSMDAGPFNFGVGGGVTGGSSQSNSVRSLADVNGDGLLDIVWAGGGLVVMFNTGNSFMAPRPWAAPGISVGKGSSVGANISASLSVGIPIAGPMGLSVGVSGSASASQNRNSQELQIASDINGDGYPDLLQSNSEGAVNVGLSQIGRTHLLKAVHNPLGGSYTIDYARTGNTYAQPHNRWVMAKVTINDGHPGDGVDEQVSTYQYLDGFYNRLERDFYGFKTVISEVRDTSQKIYRATTQTFLNDSYYNKGLLALQTVTDAAGNKWSEVENTYVLRDVATNGVLANLNDLTAVVSPELRRTDKRFYEGQAAPGKATYETFEYDAVGNAIRYFNAQDAGTADDIQADITYFNDVSKYLFIPQSISVIANGQVVRKREATIDASTGDVKQVRQYLADGQAATADIEYDVYGNILKMIGPMNAKGQRYTLTYTYDPAVNTFNTQVVDSFGYTSSATYNYKYGQAERTVDINNQPIETVLDQFGRVKMVTGPYQLGQSPYTLRFEYHPEAKPAWALTQHLDTYRDANDPIETVVFVDGLKRAIQTKKDATIHLGENGTSKDVMTVSGLVVYDFVGRALEQYYPITESLGQPGAFNSGKDSVQPTRLTYDVVDRNLCTTIPDNTQTCTSYGFGNDRNGQLQFLTQVKDANGKIKASYRDLREVITAVKEFNQGQTLWTSYEYDALKQILKVLDDKNNVTAATYDNLGRRLSLNNPDTGLVEWTYDLVGNVTQKVTANLRAQGGMIAYDYDFTRLNRIVYPQHPENNVTYTYGLPNAEFNRANRVVTVTDESGQEDRFYGRLGEIVKTIKTVASDTGKKPEVYITSFEYDTWNRLQNLTYPDGEVLTNLYDSGGLLRAISGKKSGQSYKYLNRLEYDKFDQRVFLEYGNKTRTHYTYNEQNRRLASLKAGVGAGQGKLFQDLTYEYDNVGNILGQANLAATKSPSEMGGATQFKYQYDDLYRLVHAEGIFDTQPDKRHTYRLDMQYDSIHNILLKDQLHELKEPKTTVLVQKPTTYKFAYQYGGTQPHAPTHIGTKTYTYDANGNQTGWTNDPDGTLRIIDWDEENRIQRIIDNGNEKTYKYNDAGERVIKVSAQGETVYVNQFFVIRNGSVATKHVFAGSSRLVSKLAKQENLTIAAQNTGTVLLEDGPNEHQMYFYHPDHLGSSSYVTDKKGKIFQHVEYFPFGETWVEESSNTERTPYLFTSKELDEDTGLYYFGARYYDARTSVWASVDPILDSYLGGKAGMGGMFNSFNLGLYGYGDLNPIKFLDPDGRSDIVVSGGEYDSNERYKFNFIEPAITRIKQLQKSGGGESITWLVMNAGYSGKQIKEFKDVASKLGVGFKLINSADDFTNYLNSFADTDDPYLEMCVDKRITHMSIFGHGFSGSAEFAYHQSSQSNFSWSTDDAKQLDAGAFNNAVIDFYTCNSATGDESLAGVMNSVVGGTTTGFKGQSSYSRINSWSWGRGKDSRKEHGFDIRGSIWLPEAGKEATRMQF